MMDTAIYAAEAVATYVLQFERLLRAVCFLLGAGLTVHALRLAGRRAELGPQVGTWTKPTATFASGVALMAFPAFVSVLLASLFGTGVVDSPESIFSYSGNMLDAFGNSTIRQASTSFVLLVQLIGYVAVARGVWFLNASVSAGNQKMFGPGLTFLFAGALAVNFPSFIGLLTGLLVHP